MRTLVLTLLCVLTLPVWATWAIDVESGAAWSPINAFRIPGDTGTKVSLPDSFSVDPIIYQRYRLTLAPTARDTWSVLIAPLQFTGDGSSSVPVVFTDQTFPANTPLHAKFRFNSYRLTYRRTFRPGERFSWGLGFTGKIRDAEIAVNSATQAASKKNVGFVPLLNFRATYQLTPQVGLLLDGDALAAPQGRAEDVQLAVTYQVAPRTTVRAGYRFVDGGADNEEVYNFALVNYASVGLEQQF
jgi:hypothetical protein